MKSFYTARELAGLPGLPNAKKSIIAMAQREGWNYKEVNAAGGLRREYAITSLPTATRQHLESQSISTLAVPTVRAQAAVPVIEIETPALPELTSLKGWQVETMNARMVFMRLIEQAEPTLGATKAIRHIAIQASHGNLPVELRPYAKAANKRSGSDESNRTLSERTLWRWWTSWTHSGKKAVVLAPNLGRDDQGHVISAGREEIPPWAPQFLAAYRVPQKISVAQAVANMKLPAGIAPPSVHQAYRFIEKYSKLDIERGRKSSKELLSQKSYCERDTSKFNPGDICLCDGHSFKAYVAHPAHGRPFHPEVCAVIDAVTRAAIGWSAGLAESAQTVADAIRHAVTVHDMKPEGCIPAILYTDKGAGNTSDVNAAELTGLFARLGITFKTGIPGRSQARGRVERPQKTIWISAAKRLPTYTGEDMDSLVRRKVYLHLDSTVRLAKKNGTTPESQILISWSNFLQLCQETIDNYNRTPHSALPKITDPQTGLRRHMCPLEMWAHHLSQGWQPTLPDPDELEMLFRPQISCKTRRGLVRVWGNTYHHKDLEHYHGTEVHVGFDIHDARQVWVRDREERLICIAEFEANKRDFYPVPVVEQAVELRRQRRMKTAMNRVDEIEAEAEGIKRQLAPETVQITPEQLETSDRILQLVQKTRERKIVGSVWERYEDICDRAKTGEASDYELQWKADYESFSSTGKKTGLYRDDEYCIGDIEEKKEVEG